MSHRWKQFIQGPSLHEGTGLASTSSHSKSVHVDVYEDGEKTAHFYEEIINLPSTAVAASREKRTRRQLSLRSATTPATSSSGPPPFTQLLRLAEENKAEKLESILSVHKNINLDNTDVFGWTLLMTAACGGALDCVTLLLERGANWKIVDKKGLNAFSLAHKTQKRQVCELIQKWETLQAQRLELLKQEDDKSVDQHNCVTVNSSDNSASPDFCEPCQAPVSNTASHSKSIAHLLSTSKDCEEKIHYGIPESNKGFQLMIRTGWDRNTGLGPEGKGQKFPVKTILKQDRVGLGKEKKQARITHFAPFDTSAVERQVKPGERLEKKRTIEKKEEAKRKSRQQRKAIDFRRELGSI